jgi:hypothetical protein
MLHRSDAALFVIFALFNIKRRLIKDLRIRNPKLERRIQVKVYARFMGSWRNRRFRVALP